MRITNPEAIKLTEDLGMQRYVPGREVSISQMATIKSETNKELEVFVHGALCVSYSGQCLTSESILLVPPTGAAQLSNQLKVLQKSTPYPCSPYF
jgi:collagenase-like PrtC family protease